jgi:hypothetical protein
MLTQIKIDGIDVTDYLLEWSDENVFANEIPYCNVTLLSSVKDVLSNYRTGLTVEITRGFVSPNEEYVFYGDITILDNDHDKDILYCEGRIRDAIKNGRTKQWDYNIDTQQGIGSEIFKDIADHNSFNYDSTTIVSTGTSDELLIKKFSQKGDDDFQKMKELCEIYSYIVFFNNETKKIHFQPIGYETYPLVLEVGVNLNKNLTWIENDSQMCNYVQVYGATVYDTFVETFAGPTDELTITRTPEDTELRIGGISGTLWTRIQRGVQPLSGTTYYVEEDRKRIVLASSQSNIYIRYGSQVPMPVEALNQTSIIDYGGPNAIPYFKKLVLNDLKDLDDAINKAKIYLQKYSLPFFSIKEVPVSDEALKTSFLKVGMLVTIKDPIKNREQTLVINKIRRKWPHVNDIFSAGDKEWRTELWQTNISEKINKLFYELSKNQDYLVIIKSFAKNLLIVKNDATIVNRYLICDSFTLDHHENGKLDQGIVLDNFEDLVANWTSTSINLSKSSEHIHLTESLECEQTGTPGQIQRNLSSSIDISEWTGTTSGVASRGTIGLWVYISAGDESKITDFELVLISSGHNFVTLPAKAYKTKIGYENWPPTELEFQAGWNYLLFFLPTGIYNNTIDWQNINIYRINIICSSNLTFNIDYLTISKSIYIGLNGLDRRVMEI